MHRPGLPKICFSIPNSPDPAPRASSQSSDEATCLQEETGKKKAFKKVYSLEARVFLFEGEICVARSNLVFSPSSSAFSPHLGNVYLLCCLFRAKNASGVGKLGCVCVQRISRGGFRGRGGVGVLGKTGVHFYSRVGDAAVALSLVGK